MEKHYKNIRKFLKDTDNFEELLESDSLIWVDWREYDEDIVSYVNKKIAGKIEVEFITNHKPY